jgi:16S rRNA (uracil1498-N3)-methyltransferase
MARFFLPKQNIRADRGIIDGQELEHLRRVLRLNPGDLITVFDESGAEHEAVIRALNAEQGEVEILRSYEARRESPLDLTLAVGLTKGAKMDWVVEKATELGVRTLIPFISTHAVPKLDETKIAKRTERWRKIALNAAKQCGRTRVPEVLWLYDYPNLVSQIWPETLKLLFWEGEERQSLHQVCGNSVEVRAVLLAVGPEGGFSSEEAKLAQDHGFKTVHLGRRMLRAETAAVTAVSLAQYLWGDLR